MLSTCPLSSYQRAKTSSSRFPAMDRAISWRKVAESCTKCGFDSSSAKMRRHLSMWRKARRRHTLYMAVQRPSRPGITSGLDYNGRHTSLSRTERSNLHRRQLGLRRQELCRRTLPTDDIDPMRDVLTIGPCSTPGCTRGRGSILTRCVRSLSVWQCADIVVRIGEQRAAHTQQSLRLAFHPDRLHEILIPTRARHACMRMFQSMRVNIIKNTNGA